MTNSDIIATIALIVSSGALALEIRRWFDDRPKLRVTATANFRAYPYDDGSRRIMVTVENFGTRPTSIRVLYIVRYRSFFDRMIYKKDEVAVIVDPGIDPVPFRLEVGSVWRGFIIQDGDVNDWVQKRQAVVEVFHSHSLRSLRTLVKSNAKSEKSPT